MNKCLKIILYISDLNNFCQETILIMARNCELEGTAQCIDKKTIKIIICGEKEQVDDFVDLLNKESESIQDIEIEPFLRDKDYRGVFRIIG